MATEEAHLQKAKRNVEFVRKGITFRKVDPFTDWMVTVDFYAAIHFVEAKLAVLNKHPNNHQERIEFMRDSDRSVFSAECIAKYMNLQVLSHTARYKTDVISDKDATRAQDWLETICSDLGYS